MKTLLLGFALILLVPASAAKADYVLTCRAGDATMRDVNVPGAAGFDAACGVIAQNPAYSQYTNCLDSNGARGACPVTPRADITTYYFYVQVKSFIKGFNLIDEREFDPGWFTTASCTEALMGAFVQCAVVGGEDPPDGSRASGGYRLQSEFTANVDCSGNTIVGWSMTPVTIAYSNEILVFLTTGELVTSRASPAMTDSTPVAQVSMVYTMRGKPNIVANAIAWAAKRRTCPYIWHSVEAVFACQDGAATAAFSLVGSAFPSHRLWTNNTLVKDISQGPFKNLWVCIPDNPEYVQ
jgi:hypothetical protein